MTDLGDIAGEAGQRMAHGVEFEPQTPPLGQVLLDPGLQGNPGVHAALPGQGSAMPASAPWSTLA